MRPEQSPFLLVGDLLRFGDACQRGGERDGQQQLSHVSLKTDVLRNQASMQVHRRTQCWLTSPGAPIDYFEADFATASLSRFITSSPHALANGRSDVLMVRSPTFCTNLMTISS